MSSKPTNGAPKSVRFSGQESATERPKKRPRRELPNRDEDDDVDDWAEDDDDDTEIPKEHDLVSAKRNRRLKRQGRDFDDDDNDFDEETNIDKVTSLMAESDVPVEPFNMNAEETDGTGYFDGDTYVFRKRDEEDEPDAWLESLGEDNKQPELARPRSSLEQASDTNDMDDWSKEELYAKILPLVSDNETILQALVRYGDLIKKQRKDDSSEALQLSQMALGDLTAASNALLLKGDVDIYQKTRMDLMRMVPDQPLRLIKDRPKVQWEYKGNQDGEIHGPYTTLEMLAWTQAGYFVGAQAVQIRTIQEGEKPYKSTAEELLSDLMDDNEDEPDEKTAPLVRGDWISSDTVDFTAYS
jgi:CD2 antigen cytoplasmic tail-binding protein 2